MKWVYRILTGLLLVLPSSAYASHFYFSCSDFALGGSATCTDNADPSSAQATFGANGSEISSTGSGKWYGIGTTVYINFTATGSGTIRLYDGSGTLEYVTGSQTDFPYVSGGNTPGTNGLDIYDDVSYSGDIKDICISDTVGECAPPAPPSTSLWGFPTFSTILASTSEASSLMYSGLIDPFMVILAILLGGMFAVFIRRVLWKNGKRVWNH